MAKGFQIIVRDKEKRRLLCSLCILNCLYGRTSKHINIFPTKNGFNLFSYEMWPLFLLDLAAAFSGVLFFLFYYVGSTMKRQSFSIFKVADKVSAEQ